MRKILFIFLIMNTSLYAQDPFHYFINTEAGLPTNEVYELLLSKHNGMLYAATNKGLARYNGSTVEEIDIPNNDELSITSLDQDKYGNIYFTSFQGGIWCYDGMKVSLIKQLSTTIGYPNLEVLSDSVLLFSRNTNSFYSYDIKNDLLDTVVLEDGQQNGILVFYGRDSTHAFVRSDNQNYSYNSSSYTKLGPQNFEPIAEIKFASKRFFIGNDYNLRYVTKEKIPCYIERKSATLGAPQSFKSYNGGRLLYAKVYGQLLYLLSEKGVLVYDEQFNKVAHWFKELSVSFVQKDASGTLWFSTLQKGIIAMPNSDVRKSSHFGQAYTTNLLFRNGAIHYTNAKLEYKVWPSNQRSKKLSGRAFMSQTDQFPKFLFFSNLSKNIVYNNYTAQVEETLGMGSNIKWISYFKKQHDFLISSSAGLSYLGSEDQVKFFAQKYQSVKQEKLKGDLASVSHRLDLFKAKTYSHYFNRTTGHIYLGTRNGFHLFTPDRKRKELLWKGTSIQSDFLYPADGGKTLWSGGRTGLYKIENNKVVRHWSKNEGLLKTRIDRLRKQGDTLIIIFENGVQLFSEQSGVLATYTSANYLPKAVCADACIYEQQLYVSTAKGVYILPLELRYKANANIKIASLWSKDKLLAEGEKIEYDDNSLFFKLEGAALSSRGDFLYTYRLLPNDKEWISQVSTDDEIRFNSLQEGSYTLEVKLSTSFAESAVQSYSFTIKPPWYRSWWFFLICALIILIIILLIFYIRLQQVRKQAVYSKRIKQSEITAIKAQMNPHFVFNALNSVQNLVIKKDFENTNEYLGIFSDLVRKTLQNSGKNEIELSKEVEMLELYLDLEKLRFGDEIQIHFEVTVALQEQQEIKVPPMFIQPYVENVFKHGLLHKTGKKVLDIIIKTEQQKLLVIVRDNGVGRKKAGELQARKKGAGFSTQANQKRMELLNEIYNQEIEVRISDAFDKEEDCGTVVEIKLPIKKNNR